MRATCWVPGRVGRSSSELKARASEFAHSPQAQEAVSKVADLAKQNAGKLPDPLADAVTSVADSVQHKQ